MPIVTIVYIVMIVPIVSIVTIVYIVTIVPIVSIVSIVYIVSIVRMVSPGTVVCVSPFFLVIVFDDGGDEVLDFPEIVLIPGLVMQSVYVD